MPSQEATAFHTYATAGNYTVMLTVTDSSNPPDVAQTTAIITAFIDTDQDSVPDAEDNCPAIPNGPNGGTCTPDTDNPGANCTNLVDCINSCTYEGDCTMDQEDMDLDGLGDVCDTCPDVPNGPDRGSCFNYFTQAVWGECFGDHSTCRNNSGETYKWCDTIQNDLDSDGIGDVCDDTPLP